MHRRLAPLGSLLLAITSVAAACGGSSGGDPYDLLYKAIEADRDPVQINVGFAIADGTTSTSIVIDPSQIGFVIDKAGGKGAVHVAIPLAGLDINPAELSMLGFAGDSIDVDLVYDGEALYARSPFAGALLQTILAQTGQLPDGDLSGWLRLGTTAELESLAELLSGMEVFGRGVGDPIETFPPAANAGELKSNLEGMGITLKNEGRQNQNGVDAHHLSVALDLDNLFASDYLDKVSPAEVEAARSALLQVELKMDLWLDASSGNLAEIDVKFASKTDSSQSGELTMRFRDPDGSISTDAPDDFVELPLQELIQTFMGGGLLGL